MYIAYIVPAHVTNSCSVSPPLPDMDQELHLPQESCSSSHPASVVSSRTTSAMAATIQPSATTMGETSLFAISTTSHVTLYGSTQAPLRRKQKQSTDDEEELDPTKPNDHPVMKLDSLKSSLHTVERAVTQNMYQPKQAQYRALPVLLDPDHAPTALDGITVQAPHLEKLWGFTCPLARGLCVTCMAWNPGNLVSYSRPLALPGLLPSPSPLVVHMEQCVCTCLVTNSLLVYCPSMSS